MRPAGNAAPCPRASSSRQPMGAACIALEGAGRRPRQVGPGRRADLARLLTSAGPGPTDGRWGFWQPGAAWSGCWASTFSATSPSPCSWTCRRCCRASFTQSRNLLKWYAKEFKDPLLQEPPAWFKSFLFCELVFQLPFFPIATYAFLKGSCKWIRTPAIIYSVHTMTTLIPILSTFLFEDFSKASGFKGQRPETLHERLTLISVYAPYLLIPFILLIFMLRSPYYKYEEKRKKK
ncbi:PREDICTED: transmembrane protein 97 isoform X2 [Rhinopithecus bieti]|uniref:transmembrane protein 97 isoform X2 n=1 Tax=Rhinopithecus bieti TaxID=61621 RepID=UPI00083C6716|nr:PREDICTED: transmembrane protein 97 isoform X2 [Rhinopithecus bieti]